jgi:NADP-dependent 3-hydroxy acid dehydrogenase YdfG
MANRIALITGATSGIGEATARLLAQHQYDLILCGRREDRLVKLKAALTTQTNVATLSFDVRKEEDVNAAIASLPDKLKNIDVLINNAGNAHGLSPFNRVTQRIGMP